MKTFLTRPLTSTAVVIVTISALTSFLAGNKLDGIFWVLLVIAIILMGLLEGRES